MSNMFEQTNEQVQNNVSADKVDRISVPQYNKSDRTIMDDVMAFIIGFILGFIVVFIFYKIIVASVIGGIIYGVFNIFAMRRKGIDKRLFKLRMQFFDLLEAMAVSLRAGNPPIKALESAKNDLSVLYSEDSDIIVEIKIMLSKFQNGYMLSQAFDDLAERSELEDIKSFASVYSTIEGKSSRADEIIRETQQIIADKMEIELEMETLMTAAKSEANMMLLLPLVMLLVIGYAGAGFMDAIYTTPTGRLVATGGLLVFFACTIMINKFSKIEV